MVGVVPDNIAIALPFVSGYLGGLDLVHADQLQILVLVCHKNAPFRFDF